jgi:phosphoserine phosphatase RsbU/P
MSDNASQGDSKNKLELRIAELEHELLERNRDLATYRDELGQVNGKLEALISQFSQQIQMAAQIQKTLVSTEFPNIPGFEFSTKFEASSISGGDYFDIFEHEDRFRFGLVVASSSGYSMSSLFLSVLLRMSGQVDARKATSPEKVLMAMAKEIVPNVGEKESASIFYGLFDRRSYQLHYCSLGNTLALHLSAADSRAEKLSAQGAALSRNFSWQAVKIDPSETTLSMNARDRLVVCSEGAIRVLNPSGEAFGEERLYRTVVAAPRQSVHDLRNEILYQLERFADGRELPRDVTVIVAEVKDKIIKLA